MSDVIPKLSISKTEAFERLQERISELQKIKELDSENPEIFEQARSALKRWSDYFRIFLVQIFSSNFFLTEYDEQFSDVRSPNIFFPGQLTDIINNHTIGRIDYINSIIQRLEQLEKDHIPISFVENNPQSKIENYMDIFLSHSDIQKEIAGELKRNLEPLVRCNIFLAHEDLEGGEIWAEGLLKRIKNCDLFLILLSREYHKSSYTDQETGIAYAYDKPMLPISIDGIIPYGFMSKYQPVKASKLDRSAYREIAKQIVSINIPEEELLNHYLQLLHDAFSYNCANFLADLLPVDYSYSREQINKLAKIMIENNEVSESWGAGPRVSSILEKNNSMIDREYKKSLDSFF